MLQPPPQGHPPSPPPHTHRDTPSNKQASSLTPVHPALVWPWSIEAPSHISFLWSSCQMCYSVVNNYLSEYIWSGPWTIRATRGKETLYQVPIKFEDWSLLGSVQLCSLDRDMCCWWHNIGVAYLVKTCNISHFVATWWRGWFILVRHSNKKRDNVAKSRPGSNSDKGPTRGAII